jgi:hypothetical protein
MERSILDLVKDRLEVAISDGTDEYELAALTSQLARGLTPEERSLLWKYFFELLTREDEAEDSRTRDRSTSLTASEEGAKNAHPSR